MVCEPTSTQTAQLGSEARTAEPSQPHAPALTGGTQGTELSEKKKERKKTTGGWGVQARQKRALLCKSAQNVGSGGKSEWRGSVDKGLGARLCCKTARERKLENGGCHYCSEQMQGRDPGTGVVQGNPGATGQSRQSAGHNCFSALGSCCSAVPKASLTSVAIQRSAIRSAFAVYTLQR